MARGNGQTSKASTQKTQGNEAKERSMSEEQGLSDCSVASHICRRQVTEVKVFMKVT